MTTSHHTPDEAPPAAVPPAPAQALPGGPEGAGPCPPPPPLPPGVCLVAAVSASVREPRASARRVAGDMRSRAAARTDGDAVGINAAGAPLARIAAMTVRGGPGRSSTVVAAEVSSVELGGVGAPEELEVAGAAVDASGAASAEAAGASTGAGLEGWAVVCEAEELAAGVSSTTGAASF
jgi:hypothetical protein